LGRAGDESYFVFQAKHFGDGLSATERCKCPCSV
jgi:hypothetical protein